MTANQYRPDIDGLRALAVLSVLFYHLSFASFSGGFVGVDIFFVISGFLITRLIVKEVQETDRFRFGNFYIRRVRRLYPSLLFTVFVSFLFSALLFSPEHLELFSGSLLSALGSFSNIFFWAKSGYFDAASELMPLLHTWSLSVEEQFYFIWPLLLVTLLLKAPKISAPVVLLLAGVVSLAANIVVANDLSNIFDNSIADGRATIFYMMPFRIFEFSIGAVVVWLIQYQPRRRIVVESLSALGLALIAISVFTYTKDLMFPTVYALAPCVGAALLIYTRNSKIGKILLSNRLMVSIGLISYSLYLIHWPIIVFYKYYISANLSTIGVILIIALSFVFAIFMYLYIEQPNRFRGISRPRHSNVFFGKVALLLTLIVALPSAHSWLSGGWGWRVSDIKYEFAEYGGKGFKWRDTIGNAQGNSKIILYGDSHARQYASGLDFILAGSDMGVELVTKGACMSFPNVTNIYQGVIHESCLDELDKLSDVARGNNYPIMISYRWLKTLADRNGDNIVNYTNAMLNDHSARIVSDEFYAKIIEGLDLLTQRYGENRKYIIIGNVPATHSSKGYRACIGKPISRTICHKNFPMEEGEAFQLRQKLETFSGERENVIFLDPYDALCNKKVCYVVQGDRLYYSDHAHLTVMGSRHVMSYFSKKILQLVNSKQ